MVLPSYPCALLGTKLRVACSLIDHGYPTSEKFSLINKIAKVALALVKQDIRGAQ